MISRERGVMIGTLRGIVTSIDHDEVIVEVNDIGYQLRMPLVEVSTLRTNQEVFVYTTLVVSQDSVSLYGFMSKSSKQLFSQFQKVSGVGPKAALALLSTLSSEQLVTAISNQDVDAITRTPGIGKKSAQKIILELSGKIAAIDGSTRDSTATPALGANLQEVVDGLISLGWQNRDAYAVVKSVATSQGVVGDITAEEVPATLKKALVSLDRGK
jgi:Holliday junction DNA helicase RuvA